MNPGMQTRRSNILRVGKDVLVLLEMTVLSNKTAGNNTSWFTDTEMLELLVLVRDVVCKRMEEYPDQQPETKRKKKETLPNAGIKVQPPVMLTGQRVKLGVQFAKHNISRTCLLPKECLGSQDGGGESSSHSGGGYDLLHLFPEKLQVIVCEYMPHANIANENQQTSSYFDSTKTSSEKYKTQTNTAKKKKLQLKRIVSSSSGSSVCKKSTLHGGFETSLVPSKGTSSSPSCQQRQEEETLNSLEEAPSLSKYEIAATCDVNIIPATEHKITSHKERDIYSFESDSERGDMELKLSPRKKCAKESEISNSVQDGLALSIPCQSTSHICLSDSPLNNKSSKEQCTLKSDSERGITGMASSPKQSKLSLKRGKKNRDDLSVYNNDVSEGVEQLDTGVEPLDSRVQTDSNTDNQTDAADPATLSLSGKKRKLRRTNIDDAPTECRTQTDSNTDNQTDAADPAAVPLLGKKRKLRSTSNDDASTKQVIKSKVEQTYTAIPESCSSQVKLRENGCYSPDGKTKKRKLTKKLSQSHSRWDFSSSDDDESFNIDLFRLRKKKWKKVGKKPLTNSEGDISGESGKDTDAVGAKCHDQSDNAYSSDEDALPNANFVKGTTALTQEETEEENESSKEGNASPTFDRSLKNSEVNGVSKTKKLSKIFQYETSSKTKRTEAGNGNSINHKLMGEKRRGKSEKKKCDDSDSDMTAPIYLSEESREAQEKDVSGEEEPVVAAGLDHNECDVGNSLYIAGQSGASGCRNDEKKCVREKTSLSLKKKKQFNESNLKDETCQNNLRSDDDSLLELDIVEQSVENSSEKRKIFSFHDDSRYSVKDMPVTMGEERNKEETSGVSSKSLQDDLLGPQDDVLGPQDDLLGPQDDLLSPQDDLLSPQDDLLSDDNQQENICSSHGLKKPTSNKRNFFQVDNYENVESQSNDISFEMKFSKAARKKKPPLRAKNSQNGGPFGSLKRFDDTTAPKKSRNPSLQNRRCSQIQVTPQNLDKWWLPKNGKKKERKSEVVDLVAMEEKMEEALKSVKSVSELTEEQLRYLTQNNEDYLIAIFQGKKPCHRHQEYKSSSALRTRMTYLVSYGDFPEDSLETIMDSLVPMFCRKGSKYLDYVSKVLLPELLVKICMDVLHVDYQEAEKMF